MYTDIFKNYEAFYNMVLSSTIMGNAPQPDLDRDQYEIINFIGKAYKLSAPLIKKCLQVIKSQLAEIALNSDRLAVYSERRYDEMLSETDVIADIKCDVLSKLENIYNNPDAGVNPGWFDYSHYKSYDSFVRFAKIESAGASGNVIATRQAGILKLLGIGSSKDIAYAIKRFTQCALWGDIPSIYYLAYAYKLNKDEKTSNIFTEVAYLCERYLKCGCTVLDDEVKKQFSEDATAYYVYISTIVQDVVYAYNKKNIDFSFVEAISSKTLTYYEIMNYINNYERKEWKNVTNSVEKPVKSLGFI
ncbi:MAG: hypothetical protein E7370_05850 [Clostridiales bacterium]|nr:hypothetical protein [Clostridiales bacterium]